MSKLVLSLVGIASVGVSGIGGTYALYRDNIENIYAEDLLDENEESDWKELQKKLNTADAVDASIMKDVQDKQKTETIDDANKLKQWCKEQRRTNINVICPTFYQNKVLDYVSKYCIITIKEKLKDRAFSAEDSDNTEIKKKYEELNSYSENNPELTPELKEIKKKYKAEEFQDFKNWCISTYKKGYKNSSQKIWLLADKFCKKS